VRCHLTTLIALFSMLPLASLCLFGQAETGAIAGTITDASNAIVTDAKVAVVSSNTGLRRNTTTGSEGEYAITNLKPDIYDLTIEHAGFQTYTRRVNVLVGSRNYVWAQMAVAGTSTTVEVLASGETGSVNTESQTLSQIVTDHRSSDPDSEPIRLGCHFGQRR
jgi:hypothetical protein